MSTVVEIRLTKTEFEKLFLYHALGSFMEHHNGSPMKEREHQLSLMLSIVAEREGLNDLISRHDGKLAPSEKVINKLKKVLANYHKDVIDEFLNNEGKN